MLNFPITVPALLVEQPLGIFFVAVLPAEVLLQVAYSDFLSARIRPDGVGYDLTGTQRIQQQKRIQPIADFINREDAAFPNSIILAANWEDEAIESDDPEGDDTNESFRWRVDEDELGCYHLTIPSERKLAAIIDGQHRLFAFAQADEEKLSMNLICSIFLDLPRPFQAQLFATINSTQKQVSKSLTYELFGYNLDDEEESFWSPDKLAVFLARKLGTEKDSPLKGRIVIAPRRDPALSKLGEKTEWKVSMAVVVEGIMRLITSNPKKDSNNLLAVEKKSRKDIVDYRKDKSPLRSAYIESQDAALYKMVLNYLKACQSIFWETAEEGSFITKTVGVQALFDVLRSNAASAFNGRDIRSTFFENLLRPAADIDFSSTEFRNASGSGRSLIRRAIMDACNKN